MKDLITYIVEHLVDHPEDISVREIGGDNASLLELRVKAADVGQVIGKRGRTAGALRTILTAAAAKQNKRMLLEIMD